MITNIKWPFSTIRKSFYLPYFLPAPHILKHPFGKFENVHSPLFWPPVQLNHRPMIYVFPGNSPLRDLDLEVSNVKKEVSVCEASVWLVRAAAEASSFWSRQWLQCGQKSFPPRGQDRHTGEVREHVLYCITVSALTACNLFLQPLSLCTWLIVGA